MDVLRPAESEPERTLIVKLKLKLKLPVAYAPTPVQVQLPEQTESRGAVQKEHGAVDSPQSSLVSFSTSSVRREPITSTESEDDVHLQTFDLNSPGAEILPSEQTASLPSAPPDDATTTAGADSQDFTISTDESFNGEATSERGFPNDLDLECIRVSKPRPAGEEPELEAEPQTIRPRASISINDLLRLISEEPVAQHLPSQIVASDAFVSPASEAIYDTKVRQIPTASYGRDNSYAPVEAVADVLPPAHSDFIVQEPNGNAEITAGASTLTPHTPKTGKVILRLSPTSMARLATATRSLQPSSNYGRDPNPRRSATKAYGIVKTPEAAEKPREAVVGSKWIATGARSKKRRAQGSGEHAATKRHKTDGAARDTRSSRDPSVVPKSSPEFTAGPAFDLDPLTREPRPIRDVEGDGMYFQRMISSLQVQSTSKTNDTAKEQSITMEALLQRATYAGEDDALFVTASEAKEQLAPGKFWNNIMITAEQQPLPLQTIDQFLREYYEEDVLVWIQDCSAKSSKQAPSIRQVSIKAVRERFAAGQPLHPKPWNLLELAAHHEDGLRPKFLNNEDCRLLTKLKIPTAADHTRRKTYPVGFKEVEKWALLAQAGALTLPHQDSHGYSTFITINVGLVGFGWLSSPTSEKRAEWNKTTQRFIEGTWRYVILKPGQTVYFPAGTVHFVFRLPSAGNTLAFGGHVLRCSNIVHWVRCLLEEVQSANVTNEDLTDSSTGYLERVERFVLEAKKNDNMDRWGGEESIREFLRLKAKFTSLKKQSTK